MKVSIEKKRRKDKIKVTYLDFENFGAIGRKRDMVKEGELEGKVNIIQGEWKVAVGTLVGISRKAERWGEKLGEATLKVKSLVQS